MGSRLPIAQTMMATAPLPLAEAVGTRNDVRVRLLLDSREKRGLSDHSFFSNALLAAQIPVVLRPLSVADVWWTVTMTAGGSSGREYVTPFVLERKTLADLESSFVDGRYVEQRRRLMGSGLSGIMYLLEGKVTDSPSHQSMLTAMMSLQAVSGFHVVNTESATATVDFLVRMHAFVLGWVEERLLRGDLRGLCADQFDVAVFSDRMQKTKHLPFREIFRRQLGCISGCGGYRADAITEVYPTPLALMTAYQQQYPPDDRVRALMLAELKHGTMKVGAAVSERIFRLFSTETVYPKYVRQPDPAAPEDGGR